MTPAGGVRLAPAGLLRGAAWPVDTLDAFGDADLGSRVRRGRAGWERAHDELLRRECARLWTLSLDDPRFHKALALASRSACARAEHAATRRGGPRVRPLRRVEQTLFRYLCRAAGRATPHGLWAGVGIAEFGETAGVLPMAGGCRCQPDLRAFLPLVRALAARPHYRRRARWQLNPTLHPAPEGGWRFLARRADGAVERRTLSEDAELRLLLASLAGLAPASMPDLAAQAARAGGAPPVARRRLLRLLEPLAEGGALLGGLALSARHASAEEALARFGSELEGEDRDAWRRALGELSVAGEGLAGAWAAAPVADFIGALDAAEDALRSLAQALGVAPAGAGPAALRCDLWLPWRVVMDARLQQRLTAALREHVGCWLRGSSPAARLRALEHERLAGAVAGSSSLAAAAWRAPRVPSPTPGRRRTPPVTPSCGGGCWPGRRCCRRRRTRSR